MTKKLSIYEAARAVDYSNGASLRQRHRHGTVRIPKDGNDLETPVINFLKHNLVKLWRRGIKVEFEE